MVTLFRILLIAGAIFTFASCNDNKSGQEEFPDTEHLTVSKVRSFAEPYMRFPFRVRQIDSSIFVMDLHTTEYYCHQLSYPSMTHIQSFGKRGEGPNELLGTENIRIDSQENLWLLDANQRKFAACSLTEDTPQVEIPLEEDLMRALDFTIYDNTHFLVPDYSGKHRFCKVNKQGEIIKSYFSIPAQQQAESPIALSQAWRAFIDYNPQNGIVAMVTQLGDILEIYHPEKEKTIKIVAGEYGEPQFMERGGSAIPVGIMGYGDVHVGNKYIYTLFWGHTFEDLKRNNIQVDGGNQIKVFDLDGNPVKKYILDRHITGFHIDEAQNRMIALDVNSDQPIVEYYLN